MYSSKWITSAINKQLVNDLKKDFKWSVQDISIDRDIRDYSRPIITARLDVRGPAYSVASTTELAVDLQNKLCGANTHLPEISKVIFNHPATIVIWSDKTKTVVKCQDGDVFDPEKGLAMAITKKVFGNTGNYFNIFKKWAPEEIPEAVEFEVKTTPVSKALANLQQAIYDNFGCSALSAKKEG